ncbi:hypothetical protein [Myxococcus vastator]|uniref:hypothetical protein n=1 Tax=Myxococcus vastator TaxID=2709664 RepID=UPI0013D3D319|nr:hypothetical protein [Myxococcus vastator]
MSNAALARIATAQAAVGAQYLKAGRHRLEVQSIRTREGLKRLSAIAEVLVVTSERACQYRDNSAQRRHLYAGLLKFDPALKESDLKGLPHK